MLLQLKKGALGLILIFSILMPQTFSEEISTTIYGRRDTPVGTSSDNRSTDMSHVFRHRETRAEREARARASELEEYIRAIDSLANRSLSAEPEIKALDEGLKLLTGLVEKRNQVREQVKTMDQPELRQEYVEIATASMKVSRDFYKADEYEEGKLAANIAEAALNIATSVTPGISWARDLYEAVTGKDLLSGEDLNVYSRSLAVLGSVTMGIGSKIGKGLRVLGKLMKGEKAGETLLHARRLIDSTKEIKRFSPLEKGPLHAIVNGNGPVSNTFRSGSYFELTLKEPLIVHRVYSHDLKPIGSYWSRIKPTGPLQAQLDLALLPEWANSATRWAEITIPEGTVIYEGVVSAQYIKAVGSNVRVGELLGGGNQIYLDHSIEVMKSWKLTLGDF